MKHQFSVECGGLKLEGMLHTTSVEAHSYVSDHPDVYDAMKDDIGKLLQQVALLIDHAHDRKSG